VPELRDKPSTGLRLKQPLSSWNKPLKVDFRKLFVGASKAGVSVATGRWADLPATAAEMATTLGVSPSPRELSWLLILRAIARSLHHVAAETLTAEVLAKVDTPEKIADELKLSFENDEFELADDFFQTPHSSPLLELIRPSLFEWLVRFGIPATEARVIWQRFPRYFVRSLHVEWLEGLATYEPIRSAVDSPFTSANQYQSAWMRYRAQLTASVDEPMFGESFGLRNVYVPLRCFTVRPIDEAEARDDSYKTARRPTNVTKSVSDLGQAIDGWIAKSDPNDSLRIVSGGPGSGKSSYARMLAATLSETESIPVLFIPLHQFTVSDSLQKAIESFVRTAGILPVSPLDPDSGEARLLMIFDGLDELALMGRLAADAARDFVREVQKYIAIHNNNTKRRVLVLITGREPVVQAAGADLRDAHQILHVLSYHVPDHEKKTYLDPHGLLDVDQRDVWWSQYSAMRGVHAGGMPGELRHRSLDEVTSQPLLNYLLALAFNRGKLDLSKQLNLNAVYSDLLDAVYERGWEKGRKYQAIADVSKPEFKRVLEEIALAAWHGNGRTTTIGAIEEHCRAAGMDTLLNRFTEGARAGVTKLLTAFYFRQAGHDVKGDKTFEFTHKSFREYLTACRIVREADVLEEETGRRRKSFDQGIDEKEALRRWVRVTGPTGMDVDLIPFLENEIRLRGNTRALRWQKLYAQLISAAVRSGLPMHTLSIQTFQEQDRQSKNADLGLLVYLSSCADVTKKLSRVEWPSLEAPNEGAADVIPRSGPGPNTAVGVWLSRIRGQRLGPGNGPALRSLALLDLTHAGLDIADLYGARLTQSRLDRAALNYAVLAQAALEKTSLKRAAMYGANLQGANARDASFQHAALERADFTDANLQHAHLDGVLAVEASFARADLSGATLKGGMFRKADFSGANLTGAVIEDADFTEATITGAKIDSTALRSFAAAVGAPADPELPL
jgi:uncharacterized protein YjbI with pentapeptide repeats